MQQTKAFKQLFQFECPESGSGSGSDNDSDAEFSFHDLLKQTKWLVLESRKESRAHWQQVMANAANLQCLSKEYSRVTRQLDELCTVIEEASKHSDNSTLSSLASAVFSILTMGSASQMAFPQSPLSL